MKLKVFIKKATNILICILILISIISFREGLKGTYKIKYTDDSKEVISNFISANNVKLKNKVRITNVTMDDLLPYGHRYTIYYIDTNNEKQFEEISRKSDNSLKKYIIQNGEHIGQRYINVSKISMITAICIIIVKAIIVGVKNYKDKSEIVC